MPINVIDKISDIQLLPIRALFLADGEDYLTGDNKLLEIRQIETESSWSLDPVAVPNMHGGMTTVGYRFAATIYFPQNKLQTAVPLIEDFISKGVYASIELGSSHPWTQENRVKAIATINTTGNIMIDVGKAYATLKLEQIQLRPRAAITLNRVIKGFKYGYDTTVFDEPEYMIIKDASNQ